MAKHELFIPEYLLEELTDHRKELAKKTNLSPGDIRGLFHAIIKLANISIISETSFAKELVLARTISPDPDDVQYLALALHLNCAVWSNDKLLKKQDTVRVYSTEELVP